MLVNYFTICCGLIAVLLVGCTVDCCSSSEVQDFDNVASETSDPASASVASSHIEQREAGIDVPHLVTVDGSRNAVDPALPGLGYTNACSLKALHFQELAVSATSLTDSDYLYGIAAEFQAKVLLADDFTRDLFNNFLRDNAAKMSVVFGSPLAAYRVFIALVAAHEFSGTPFELKPLLFRTFKMLMRNASPPHQLPERLVGSYLRLMESLIPLTPRGGISIHTVRVRFDNFESQINLL